MSDDSRMGDEYKDDQPLLFSIRSPRSNYLKREFPRPPLIQKRISPLTPKSPKQIHLNRMRKSLEKTRKVIQYRHSLNRKKSVKKSARKTFIARNAYTILGHGEEGSSTFILPDNCMVITLAHPGELIYADKSNKYYRKLATMDMNILLNPLQHKHELTKNFGPLKFYPPGSKCPDFFYQLSSIFPHKNLKVKSVNENDYRKTTYEALKPGSGVVNIKSLQKDSHESYGKPYATKEEIESYTNEDIHDEILSHYNNSLFPTQDAVQDNIEIIMNMLNERGSTAFENYQYTLETMHTSHDFDATQSELIHELPSGVYYNFVCRDISRVHDVFYTKNIYDISRPNMKTIPYLKAKHRETGENKYRHAVNVIDQRIGNFSRKELARNLYTSNSFKRKLISEVEDELEELLIGKDYSEYLFSQLKEGNLNYNGIKKNVLEYHSNIERKKKSLEKLKHNLKYQKQETSALRRRQSLG